MVPLLANVAIPTFAFLWFPLALLFFPVCWIEAYVLSRSQNRRIGQLLWSTMRANFYSATWGYLVIWCGMFVAAIIWTAARSAFHLQDRFSNGLTYLVSSLLLIGGKIEYFPRLDWLAIGITLAIGYFASVLFERRSLSKSLAWLKEPELTREVQKMNRWSYAFLGVLWLCALPHYWQ